MAKLVSDAMNIMRLAIGKRNANDPDSTNAVLLSYISDFANLTMSDDLKIFEQFDTLTFNIGADTNDGVYTFNDLVGVTQKFTNISEGFISLATPARESVSWNTLRLFQDPREFFRDWGINNEDIIIKGFPTQMLFYGNTFTFRTIPQTDVEYIVNLYGYKVLAAFSSQDEELPFDHWMRYLAYGGAMNYARDYRFETSTRQQLQQDLDHERNLLLTRTHNQIKLSRAKPRF